MTNSSPHGARKIHGKVVHGVNIDAETRCGHWQKPTDIIALRMKCCSKWYSCYDCHTALVDHPPQTWPRDQHDQPAVLCGVCGAVLNIASYLRCDFQCPHCQAAFNPRCETHYHLYFELD
jgi:uncharacterized CHY-type Zn-finger protein